MIFETNGFCHNIFETNGFCHDIFETNSVVHIIIFERGKTIFYHNCSVFIAQPLALVLFRKFREEDEEVFRQNMFKVKSIEQYTRGGREGFRQNMFKVKSIRQYTRGGGEGFRQNMFKVNSIRQYTRGGGEGEASDKTCFVCAKGQIFFLFEKR